MSSPRCGTTAMNFELLLLLSWLDGREAILVGHRQTSETHSEQKMTGHSLCRKNVYTVTICVCFVVVLGL